MQARLEGEAAQLKEAHSKTLEELAWKHHTAIEAVHSNANKEKKKLQMVGLCFLNNQTYYKKQMIALETCSAWFCCMASFIWSYLQICCASLKTNCSAFIKITYILLKKKKEHLYCHLSAYRREILSSLHLSF